MFKAFLLHMYVNSHKGCKPYSHVCPNWCRCCAGFHLSGSAQSPDPSPPALCRRRPWADGTKEPPTAWLPQFPPLWVSLRDWGEEAMGDRALISLALYLQRHTGCWHPLTKSQPLSNSLLHRPGLGQTNEDKCHMISFVCGILNKTNKQKTHRYKEQISGCQREGVVGGWYGWR